MMTIAPVPRPMSGSGSNPKTPRSSILTHTDSLAPADIRAAIVRDPLRVSPHSTVLDAITQMGGSAFCCDLQRMTMSYLEDIYQGVRSSCVVVDDSGQVVGILTERDVVRLGAQQQNLEHLTVGQVMSQPVLTLRESELTDLFTVITLLQQRHIRHLPIVDDQATLVGVLTYESLRQMTRPIDLLRLRSVSEVMTRQVVCAQPQDTMLTIAQRMAHQRVSSVIIVTSAEGPTTSLTMPVGIVTERDVVQFQALGLNLKACLAADIMSAPVFTVEPEESLWAVQQMMGQHWIRRVAVTGKQEELLGIVTQSSLLQALNPLELYNLAAVLEEKVACLEAEKGQLAAIVESSQDAIISHALDGTIISWNRAAEQLFGYPPQAALGQPITRLIPPQHQAEADRIFQCLCQGELVEIYETQRQHRDGHLVDVAITLSPICNEAGQVVGASKIVRDISDQQATRRDRQRIEAERQRAEASLRHMNLVLENVIEGISHLDSDGRYLTVNRAYAAIVGYPPEELVGQVWTITVDDRDVPMLKEAYQTMQQVGKVEVEARGCRQDGTSFYKQVTMIADYDSEGHFIGHYCFLKDISDRKASELALQEVNQQLEARIADLHQRHAEMVLLSEMSDCLQACLTVDEACAAFSGLVAPLFPDCAGELFLTRDARNGVERVSAWGDTSQTAGDFLTADCWALRWGRFYAWEPWQKGMRCRHLPPLTDDTQAISLCIPMLAQGETLGLFSLTAPSTSALSKDKRQLARTVAEQVALAIANLNLRATLQSQSIRDPLTGLFNRRYLEESLNQEIARAQRHGHAISVLMIDIDHFKGFNDTYGHDAGDYVLKTVSTLIANIVRGSDIACRYGGEELTVLLPELALEQASRKAEDIRIAIATLPLSLNGQFLGPITASLGVAEFPRHGRTGAALLQTADAALYRAKAAGRNQVIVAP